jgi:hypothetical protein
MHGYQLHVYFLISLLLEFEFLNCLFKKNSCPIVLDRLSVVCRFVDLLVPDFESFMFRDKESFGVRIYPEMSCELNCTSNGSSCTF